MQGPLSNYINPDGTSPTSSTPTGRSLSDYIKQSPDSGLFGTGTTTIDQSKYLPYTQLLSGQNFDINRALGQTNWNQFKNLMVRGGAKALLTIPESIGYLGDIPSMLGIVDDFDNKLSAWVRDQKENVTENNPDYSSVLHDPSSFDPGSFDWWMRNGDSIVESLGYFIPGGVVGKLTGNLLKALGTGVRATELGSALGAATAMNYVESMQIAGDTYRNLLESGASKEVAAKEASRVVWEGKVLIATEMPQYLSLMRGFGKLSSRSMKDIDKSVLKTAGKEYLKQFGAESGEEVYQGFIQSEAERRGKISIGKMEDDGSAKMNRFWDYFTSDQGLTEAFLGGIGGTMFQGAIDGVSKAADAFKGKESRYNVARKEVTSNSVDLIDLLNKNVKNAEEKTEFADSGDMAAAEVAELKEFMNLAVRKAETGTYKQFLDTFDKLSQMTADEAATHGIDLTKAKEQLAKYKLEAVKFEKIYNQVQNVFGDKNVKIRERALNNLYEKGFLNEQNTKLSNEINDVYADTSNLKLKNQNLHFLKAQRKALKRDLSFLEKISNKTDKMSAYEKFVQERLSAVEKNIFSAEEFERKKIDTPNSDSLIQYETRVDDLGIGEETISKNLDRKNRNDFQISELIKEYDYLKSDKAEKDAKKSDEAEAAVSEEKANAQKIERERKPFDDLIKVAKTPNVRVNGNTKTDLEKAYEAFTSTDTFKALPEDAKAKIVQEYKEALALIDDKLATQAILPEGVESVEDIDTEEDVESFNVLMGAISNQNTGTVTKHLTEESASKKNRDNNKANSTRNDATVRKKEEIISFGYLNIDYIVDGEGNIIDRTNGEKLEFVTPDDERLYDYTKFKPGTEFEIVLDTEYAAKNGIELTKENIYRIPFGIKLKDGPITAWIHKFDKPVVKGTIDKRIEDLIRPPQVEESFDIRQQAQDNLLALREHLFEQIITNKNQTVKGVVSDKSQGYIHFGANRTVIDAMGDGKTLAKDVTFGVINDIGQLKLMDTQVNNTASVQQFSDLEVAKEFSGALVVMLPTNAVDGTRPVLTPQFINVDNLSEDDIETALHVIYNYTKPAEVAKVKGIPNTVKTTEDLLNLIVYNGLKTKNFSIVNRNNKRYLQTTAFVASDGRIIWDEKSSIEINDVNKDQIRDFLKTKKYNININTKQTHALTLNKGELTATKVKNDVWIAMHTFTDIESRPIGTSGRMQFFFQPVITFKVDGFNTDSPSETIINAAKKIIETRKDEDDDALPNPIIVDETPIVTTKKEVKEEELPSKGSKKTRTVDTSKKAAVNKETNDYSEVAAKAFNSLTEAHKEWLLKNVKDPVDLFKVLESETPGIVAIKDAFMQMKEDDPGSALSLKAFIDKISKQDNLIDEGGALNVGNRNFISNLEQSKEPFSSAISSIISSTDEDIRNIGYKLNTLLGNKGVKFEFVTNNSNVVATAIYGDTLVIRINKNAFIRSKREYTAILAHEMLHLVTGNALTNPATESEKEFSTAVNELYEYTKTIFGTEEYALSNVKEFLSEAFTNPEFKQRLKDTPYNVKGRNNIFSKFIEYISKLLGLSKPSVYDIVSKHTNKFLSNAEVRTTENRVEDNIYEIYLENDIPLGYVNELLGNINYLAIYDLRANPNLTQAQLYDLVRRRLKGALNDLETKGLKELDSYRILELVLDNKGDNPLFADLVAKSKIYIQNNLTILRDFTTDENMPEFLAEDDIKGKEGYGKESFELNPKDSASRRLKYRLSFTPDGYFDENGNAKPKRNMFGMQSFVPFDALYNTIINVLTDKRSEDFLQILEKIAQYNPSMALYYNDLVKSSTSTNKNDQAYYKEFLSHFQKQKAKFLNVVYNISEYRNVDEEDVYIDFGDEFGEESAPKVYMLKTSFANDREATDLQIADWYDKFRYGSLIMHENGVQILDKVKVKALQERFNSMGTFSLKEKLKNIIEGILPELGITMEPNVADMMINDFQLIGDDFTVANFTEAVGRLLTRAMGDAKKVENSKYNQFGNENFYLHEVSSIKLLANINMLVTGTKYSSMYRNEEGKNIYTIFHNTLLSSSFRDLTDKNSSKFQNYLRSDFHKNNHVIQAIANDEHLLDKEPFVYELSYFSTFGEESKHLKGSGFMKLSPQDREYVRFSMFLNNGNKYAFFQAPTMSDKPTIPLVRTNKFMWAFENETLSNQAKDAIFNGIKAEHDRIQKVKRDVEAAKANPSLFKSLIETYHYGFTDGKPDYNKAQGLIYHFFPSLNSFRVTTDQALNITALMNTEPDIEVHKEAIMEHVTEIVKDQVAERKAKYKEYGFMMSNGQFAEKMDDPRIPKAHNDIIADYVVNYMIHYMTFYQLFSNDIAFCKGMVDMSKRNAGVLAPGQDFNIEGDMKTVILNDVSYPSTSLNTIYQSLLSMFKAKNYEDAEERTRRIVDNYTDINNTDAQGYISLDEYERWLDGLGRLDNEMIDIISAVRRNDIASLTEEQLNKVLQPFKPVYVEDVWDDTTNTLVRKYIKLSVIPLFEELTSKFPDIDNIRKQMESKDIGLIAYRSASKEGTQYVEEFYTNSSEEAVTNIPSTSIQSLPYTGLRLQQELPYDKNKEEINTVSQSRKLIFQDLTDSWFQHIEWDFFGKKMNAREFQAQHESLHIANIEEKYKIFAEEFGIAYNGETDKIEITNIQKVNKVLLDEAKTRGFSDNSQMALQLTDDGTNFVIPMWLTPQSEQFETLLLSIVNSKIVKQKHQGKSAVQVSNQGFKPKTDLDFTGAQDIEWMSAEHKARFETYIKRPALLSVEIVDGKLSPEQILLPNIYKKYFKGKKITYQDLSNAGLLNLFAMRIPNQGHNSMASVEIAGFLPEVSGDMVVVHQDMLKRMGSDFDVDKLYIYYHNVELDPIDGLKRVEYLDGEQNADIRWKLYQERILKAGNIRKSLAESGINIDGIRPDEADNNLINTIFNVTGTDIDDVMYILQEEKLMYTEDEFKKLPVELQNSREARENAILNIYLEIFSHPEILLKMYIPNSVEPLRDANNFYSKGMKQTKPIPLTIKAQDDLFESNSSGKTGIGITSLWNTFHSQLQYHKVNLQLYYFGKDDLYKLVTSGVKFLDKDDNIVSEKFHSKDTIMAEKNIWDSLEKQLDIQIPEQYRQFGLYRLGKTKGRHQFDYISNLLQVFQSAAVDNAKEQELNIANLNADTFNTACYIAAMGVDDFNLIVGLLRQPYIVKFTQNLVKRRTKTKDIYETGSYTEQAYNETMNDLLGRLRELKHIPKDYVLDLKLVKAFGVKDFEKGISGADGVSTRDQTIAYYEDQIEMLKAFYVYKHQADELAKAIAAYNIDVRGVGKAWYEVVESITDLENSGIIPTSVRNPYFQGLETLSEKTLPGALIRNAFYPASEIYNTDWLFPYSKGLFQNVFNNAFAMLGIHSPSENDYKSLRKYFLTYLVSNSDNGLFETNDLEKYRYELMHSDNENNLAKRLVALKAELPNNYLLSRLSVSTRKAFINNKIEKIDFAKQKVEKSEEPFAIAAFLELLNSPDENVSKFAKDLIAYSFLNDGINQSIAGISHIVPIQYLIEKGYGDFYKEFNPGINNDTLYYRFLKQFVRNKPDVLKRKSNKGVLFQGNRALVPLGENAPPYLAKYEYLKKERVYLFEGIGTGHAIYRELEPLGLGIGLIEMDINHDEPRSIIEANHTVAKFDADYKAPKVDLDDSKNYVNFEDVTEKPVTPVDITKINVSQLDYSGQETDDDSESFKTLLGSIKKPEVKAEPGIEESKVLSVKDVTHGMKVSIKGENGIWFVDTKTYGHIKDNEYIHVTKYLGNDSTLEVPIKDVTIIDQDTKIDELDSVEYDSKSIKFKDGDNYLSINELEVKEGDLVTLENPNKSKVLVKLLRTYPYEDSIEIAYQSKSGLITTVEVTYGYSEDDKNNEVAILEVNDIEILTEDLLIKYNISREDWDDLSEEEKQKIKDCNY